MKLNRKWLNEEFVDLSNVSDKEFVETLTVFGQKVETWERLDAEIKNVVVGKVLPCTIPGFPAAFTSPRASSGANRPTVCSAPSPSWV